MISVPPASAAKASHAPSAKAVQAAAAPAIRATMHVAAMPGREGVRVVHAALHNGRPLAVGRLVEGRPVREAARLLPLLLSLCGHAHALAFRLAARAAAADAVDGAQPAQTLLPETAFAAMRLEALREHALSLFHHWPALLGMKPPQALPALLQAIVRLMKGPEDEKARGQLAAQWSALLHAHLPLLVARLRELHLPPAPPLDPVEEEHWPRLAVRLLADETADHARRPTDGKGRPAHVLPAPPAMTAMRRTDTDGCGDWPPDDAIAPVRARLGRAGLWPLAARLDHLEALLVWLRGAGDPDDVSVCRLGNRQGMARVLTARGWLLHGVETAAWPHEGRQRSRHPGDQAELQVRRCVLLAPTEWHCHPEGLAARWLAALQADTPAHLKRQATAVMRLADPCEAFAVALVEETDRGDGTCGVVTGRDTGETEVHA